MKNAVEYYWDNNGLRRGSLNFKIKLILNQLGK
jgi:hypothetical protein